MKLDSVTLLLAIQERNWGLAVSVMSHHFNSPFHTIPEIHAFESPDAPPGIVISSGGLRYCWQAGHGFKEIASDGYVFWTKDGPSIKINYK